MDYFLRYVMLIIVLGHEMFGGWLVATFILRRDVRVSSQFKGIHPNSYCISYLLLDSKLSPNLLHKTIHAYCITGRARNLSTALLGVLLQALLSGCSRNPGRGSKYQFWVRLRQYQLRAHSVVVGEIHFSVGYWAEGLSSLLGVGQWLPSIPSLEVLSTTVNTWSEKNLREKTAAREKSQLFVVVVVVT